jgi:hypothetical protein
MPTSPTKIDSHRHKAWVVAVDMGYGHQRAAQPLHHLASGGIISANTYSGIPAADRALWQQSRQFYDFISRFKRVPVIGEPAYRLYDRLQRIAEFYPRRDLSRPNMQVRAIYQLMRRKNWGKHLIAKLGKKPLPFITTFFVPAFMAEYFDYPGEIFCITTDTDISRAWVGEHPNRSRITYFASNVRVVERLQEYGVPVNRIILTGFPLPTENLGTQKLDVVKHDLIRRIVRLDPDRAYQERYPEVIQKHLGRKRLPPDGSTPLTVMFAVGGAGAQEQIGATILRSVAPLIREHKLKLILVAGVHNQVSTFFHKQIIARGLRAELGRGVSIIVANSKPQYFAQFNRALRTSDVLWTKPSELSFYCALGVPIIMAPSIGSQEDFNRHWLTTIGAGIDQEDPRYAHEWLLDWAKSGWLAEAAMQGFVEAPKFGTYNIEQFVFHRPEKMRQSKMAMQF